MAQHQEGMQLFHGRNSREVLQRIRHELGDDAVIVSTRTRSDRGGSSVVEIAVRAASNEVVPLPPPESDDAEGAYDFAGLLREAGLEPELTLELCRATYSREEYSPRKRTIEGLRAQLTLGAASLRSPISVVLGPTGVGKTTTIAKLAARYLMGGVRTGLISLDTRRVGAIEHLAAYARLLDIECHSASSPMELKRAIRSLRRCRKILVDTPGIPHDDWELRQNLASQLAELPNTGRLLLLPAAGHPVDLGRVLAAYGEFDIHGLGIAKADETAFFGPCLSTVSRAALPIEVICTGQQVPEDIEMATAEKLAALLLQRTN